MKDSPYLFDVTSNDTVKSKKSISFGLQTVEESSQELLLNIVAFIRSKFMRTNPQKKIRFDHLLFQILKARIFYYPGDQCKF